MESLVWEESYLTGLAFVDEQHRELVDLINRLGSMLRVAATEASAIETAFADLSDYAAFHFSEEEKLMSIRGLDARQLWPHVQQHESFLAQITVLQGSRHGMADAAATVHGFLSSWLVYHVLGEDHVMARQLALIADGDPPALAFTKASKPENASIAALLAAMKKLYRILTKQNLDLMQANRDLNRKASERMTELATANAHLKAEHEASMALLARIDDTQKQLLQTEKMASIGQLAAGVAHEINNPVGFVNSNLGTLDGYVGRLLALVATFETIEAQLPEAARQALVAAKKAADLDYLRQDIGNLLQESMEGLARVRKIVQDLKDFSRVGEVEWQEVDLLAGVESTLNVVWNEIKYKAVVVRELKPLPPVRCVPAQMNQVFMNLLVNAAQAIETQGTITLSSGVELDQVWIEVADSGKGMTPAVRQKIFEPFFTTKPMGKGTGLGLSLSYDIVARHGGRFDVTSTVGVGTTFRLWLPVDGPPDTATVEQPS